MRDIVPKHPHPVNRPFGGRMRSMDLSASSLSPAVPTPSNISGYVSTRERRVWGTPYLSESM